MNVRVTVTIPENTFFILQRSVSSFFFRSKNWLKFSSLSCYLLSSLALYNLLQILEIVFFFLFFSKTSSTNLSSFCSLFYFLFFSSRIPYSLKCPLLSLFSVFFFFLDSFSHLNLSNPSFSFSSLLGLSFISSFETPCIPSWKWLMSLCHAAPWKPFHSDFFFLFLFSKLPHPVPFFPSFEICPSFFFLMSSFCPLKPFHFQPKQIRLFLSLFPCNPPVPHFFFLIN